MSGLRTAIALAAAGLIAAQPVTVRVDLSKRSGPVRPVWAFFGYDEPNYTYMKDGTRLLSEIARLSPVPVYVRTHNLLSSGDATPALKWGSTNAYTEDAQGRPVYDWSVVDRIFDTYVQRGMKPLAEIGFMPEALSSHPQPYRHNWKPGEKYNDIYTGWAYPPKDYAKWAELVYRWVSHCVERYGRAEVESWLWEVWNEPDIGYWKGTPEQFYMLYDFAADAVKRALPTAKIGGPDSTGPRGQSAAAFLRGFLDHVTNGQNHAIRAVGAPLDFVSFHAKGAPKFVDGGVVMGIERQLQDLAAGFEIVASYPALKGKPVIIGESDPEGCAACSSRVYPQNSYRNGLMYASYTAAVMPRHLELAQRFGINLRGAVTWAFEFEDQPWFDGFRDLATNGVDKPVLNVFRMLGLMTGERVDVENGSAARLDDMLLSGVKGAADLHAVASADARSAAVLVSNYHDSSRPADPAEVDLVVESLPRNTRILVQHFRVDRDHSNSYEAWNRMGSPTNPTAEQRAVLEAAGQLATVDSPQWVSSADGSVRMRFALPRHAVSLIRFDW